MMKMRSYPLWLGAGLLLLALGSCSQRGATLEIGQSNKVFGKIPALCAAEAGALARLAAADQETLNPEKLIRNGSTRILLERTIQERLTEEVAKVQGRQVPCEADPQAGYEVREATVTWWDYPARTLGVALRVLPRSGVATEADTICYLKSVDRDGAMLDFGVVTLTPVVEGPEGSVLMGDYACIFEDSTRLDNPDFTAFAKLVVIPTDEYSSLDSLRTAAWEAEEARKQAEIERAQKAYQLPMNVRAEPGNIPGLPTKTK